jgi:4-aminobutyrate aminotransferase / (S)-3-amino-2-methylpropionate transaminase / 5-aminovalerate transaminase
MRESSLAPQPTTPVATRWRRIRTPIPVPESTPAIERLRRVEPRSMTAMPPIVWHEAEGFCVRDPYGNQWIDLSSGIVMANAGHGHPRIVAAIHQAADAKLLASYAFPTDVRTRLLAKVVALAPVEDAKAIVYCAGTEATECAMALMRRHGRGISPKKVGILSFADGYHGRTLSASLAGGSPGANDWIAREQVGHYQISFPFCPRCPWGRDCYDDCGESCFHHCLNSLATHGIEPEQIAGIIAEPAPGWATWPIPRDFAQAMRTCAAKYDILITFDEVQCGCARTGRFFGFEHTGVIPDLIVLGKGLTSSLPVSALVGPAWLMDLPAPGEMSSTHGGNPVCAAAALANLEVIEEEHLADRAAATGAAVLEKLRQLQHDWPEYIRSIHGPGLFISIHLQVPNTGEPYLELADAVVAEAVRRGVLMFPTSRGFLKFVPPLCIELEAALEAVDVIQESFEACVQKVVAPAPQQGSDPLVSALCSGSKYEE